MGYLRTFVFIFELLLGSLALGALFISPLAIALKVSLSALFFLFAGMLEFQSYDRDLKFEAMANSLEVALCALESQQLKESDTTISEALQNHIRERELTTRTTDFGSTYVWATSIKLGLWLAGGAGMAIYVLPLLLKS